MIIRRLAADDIDQLIVIAEQFHGESKGWSKYPFDEDGTRMVLKQCVTDPPNPVCYVCTDNKGYILGAIGLVVTRPPYVDAMFANDLFFYVMPHKRGSKAASLLMDVAVEWCQMVGAKRLTMGNSVMITPRFGSFMYKHNMTRSGSLYSIDL